MKKMVLVVDDEESIRGFLRQALEGAGFAVEEAGDGEEALNLLHRKKISCIVTDLDMPRMNGVRLAKEVRRLFPQVPAIMLTGDTNLAAGAPVFRIVRKPIGCLADFIKLIQFVTGGPVG